MLKNLKLGLIAFICMGLSFAANAQKAIKEGTITYAVEYNLPPDQQSMAAMLPTEYKVEFKGNLSRFKMDMGMFATSVIYNDASKEMMSLTEVPMQNKKIAVKMNKDQTKKMQDFQSGEKDFEIKTTTDTKQIAGYNCKKYIFKDKISGDSMDVWATNDVNIPENTFSAALKGLNGFPVQFENNARGMKSKLTLKSIKEEPITAIDMTIPSGFETMTFEDIMAQMGG
jgi:GLPGLI family protein